MRFTHDQISKLPQPIQDQINAALSLPAGHPRGASQDSVAQHPLGDGPLAKEERKAVYTGRVLIRFVSFRRKLLDRSNLCAKYFEDCCVYAGLVLDDSEDLVICRVRQRKVSKAEDERTEITIVQVPEGYEEDEGILPPIR